MKLQQDYEIDKESYYKSKKYVIKIFPENVEKIESLDIRDRDQFVNNAISAYLNHYNQHKKQEDFLDKFKKITSQAVCVIVLIALFAAIVRFLMVYSDSNSEHMQNNFQRLYENSHLE